MSKQNNKIYVVIDPTCRGLDGEDGFILEAFEAASDIQAVKEAKEMWKDYVFDLERTEDNSDSVTIYRNRPK